MKTIILAVCLMFALPCFSYSQEEKENEEKPEISFLKFQRSKFILLDQDKFVIKRGLKKNDMEALLEGNEDALQHYKKFRTLRTLKHVSRGVGAAGFITAIVLISSPDYNIQDAGFGVLTGSVLFMVGIQLPIAISAGSQAGKAVDEHNMIMSKNKTKYSLQIGTTGNGVGLALNF